MIYAYTRVSTNKQDYENQKIRIKAKTKSLGLNIKNISKIMVYSILKSLMNGL